MKNKGWRGWKAGTWLKNEKTKTEWETEEGREKMRKIWMEHRRDSCEGWMCRGVESWRESRRRRNRIDRKREGGSEKSVQSSIEVSGPYSMTKIKWRKHLNRQEDRYRSGPASFSTSIQGSNPLNSVPVTLQTPQGAPPSDRPAVQLCLNHKTLMNNNGSK